MPSSPPELFGSVKTETNWSKKNNNDGGKRRTGRRRQRRTTTSTGRTSSHCCCCCCCPCCGLRCATVVFACLELFIFTYQLIMTILDMFSSADQPEDGGFLFFGGSSPSSTLVPDTTNDPFLSALPVLPLILLAITVVVLLLLGTVLRAPFLLIPHLLMQLSFFIVNLFLVCYLAFWWKKGVSMQFSAVVYESSEEGEEGLSNANQLSPFETHLTVSQMGSVAGGLTILFAILLVVQLLLILLVFATFLRLLRLSAARRRISDEGGEEGDTEKCSTAMTQLSSVRTGVSPSASSANPTSGGGISSYSNLSVLNSSSNANNIRQPNHQQQRPQQNVRPRPPAPSPSLRPPSNFVARNNNNNNPNPSLSRSSSLGTRTWASRVPRVQLQVAPVAPIMAAPPVVAPSADTIHPHNYTNTTTIITDRDNTTMEEDEEISEYEPVNGGALTAMSTYSI